MFNRILLAVDATSSREVAVSYAIALARSDQTSGRAAVRVVHANELLVGGRGFARETEREAAQLIEGTVDAIRSAGITADGVCVVANSFDVASRIAEAAEKWSADVIVLGSRRRRPSRWRGVGLRERVTAASALPVLAAPSPLDLGSRTARRSLAAQLPTVEEAGLIGDAYPAGHGVARRLGHSSARGRTR